MPHFNELLYFLLLVVFICFSEHINIYKFIKKRINEKKFKKTIIEKSLSLQKKIIFNHYLALPSKEFLESHKSSDHLFLNSYQLDFSFLAPRGQAKAIVHFEGYNFEGANAIKVVRLEIIEGDNQLSINGSELTAFSIDSGMQLFKVNPKSGEMAGGLLLLKEKNKDFKKKLLDMLLSFEELFELANIDLELMHKNNYQKMIIKKGLYLIK